MGEGSGSIPCPFYIDKYLEYIQDTEDLVKRQ